jgi:hypothetical protein
MDGGDYDGDTRNGGDYDGDTRNGGDYDRDAVIIIPIR